MVNKSTQSENIIILGGGIPGIFSALYLSKLNPNWNIHLIESSKQIGGLYNSFNHEEGGTFDKGMHIIYETCISEIDSIIRDCLNKDEWLYLEGNYKDIAGVFHNKKLEKDSPYMHIESLNRRKLNICLGDFLKTLKKQAPNFKECSNAEDFFQKRFGTLLTKELIEPVIQKLWGRPLNKLHPSSTRIVLMDRLRMFSEETTSDLMKSELIRSRIAYPNQMKLEKKYRNSQRGLYPKKFGMSNLIKGMEINLEKSGINVHRNSSISSIEVSNNLIKRVSIKTNNSLIELDSIKFLHSTISSSKILNLFGINHKKVKLDKSHIQKYVYFLIDSKPNMGNLYYFFSFQKGSKLYRVTNYAAYCPSAIRTHKGIKAWPICIELHYKNKNPNDKEILNDGISELLKTKVIQSSKSIIFSKVESAGGFPLLTLRNCAYLQESNSLLENLKLENLLIAGQAPDKGIFFLHDILKNIFELINNKLS